ncbi:hypothetical protein [Tropicibacter sp. Alg240-R139]|uniref:portal protein n=1 Tax=Tropicibacter sp. Alg240-R139 TaxID=2305991 RepID=UPI0013DF9B4F|nr:hypothetical protein [Tropicibacter sp. Alg240-R139]
MVSRNQKQLEKLAGVIQIELSRAEGADQNDIAQNREEAIKYYNGDLPPVADSTAAGATARAADISMDVADMTNAVLAQLTPMLSTDALVNFEAKGKQDEPAAKAESEATNYVIVEQNRGFAELQSSIKDALMLRNGCMKVYVDDEVITRDIPTTISPTVGANNEPIAARKMTNEEIAVTLIPRAANETRELKNDLIRVTTTKRHFRAKSVPLDNISYEANAKTRSVQELRFFSERILYKRSDLVDMGHSKKTVDDLPYITDKSNLVEDARNFSGQQANISQTRDQDVIECFEVHLRIDLNGDGISELYRVLIAGKSAGTVLEYEEVDFVPYAMGTAFIQPHRILGESLFDHLKQTQNTKTTLLRNSLDNQSRIINGSWVADPDSTNMQDLLTGSQVVRHKTGREFPIHIQVPDLGPTIFNAMTYQDKMRTERGGAALDMMSADAQLVGETAYGIERQYAQRELLTAFMGRNLAETLIRPLYLIMHEYMRRYSNEPLELKVNGEWTQVDPRQWPRRDRCNVKAGMSAGERTHIQRTLQQLLQWQTSAMQVGMNGQLADMNTVYNTVYEWATYAGLDNPDAFVINPKSEQAQQAAQQTAQQQQAQQQAAQQMQQQIVQLEQTKLQQEAKKSGDELAYKYWSDRLKAETEEAKVAAQGTIDLEKTQLQGEQRERAALNGAQSSVASTGGTQR